MKIGFITYEYGAIMGGVGTSSQRISQGLQKKGHQVHVFFLDSSKRVEDADFHEIEEDEGVIVHRVGPWVNSKLPSIPGMPTLTAVPEIVQTYLRRRVNDLLLKVIAKYPIDCLISFNMVHPGILPIFLSRHFDIPFVAGLRGSDIGVIMFGLDRLALLKMVIESADRIVSVNQYLGQRMQTVFPMAESKTKVITNGYRIPEIRISKQEARARILDRTGWAETDLILVFSGTMREEKGLLALTQLLPKIERENIRLFLIGPGLTERDKLVRGKIWDSFVENNQIHITGLVERSEVLEWAYGGDVIFFPSTSEGIANGLIEGMGLGLCPLVSHVLAEVVEHGQSGWVVPANDVEGFREALLHLNQNRELVRQMGIAAQQSIRSNFKPEEEIDQYDAVLREVVEERKS